MAYSKASLIIFMEHPFCVQDLLLNSKGKRPRVLQSSTHAPIPPLLEKLSYMQGCPKNIVLNCVVAVEEANAPVPPS